MKLHNILRKKINQEEQDVKILLVSLQKCGTHLIFRLLEELGLEGIGIGDNCQLNDLEGLSKNQFLWTHFCPSDSVLKQLEENPDNYKILFNYRDPRDAIVSWYHWQCQNTNPLHSMMDYSQKAYSTFTKEDLIDIFIKCDKFRPSEYAIPEHFRLCRFLFFHPNCLNIRFEQLIGDKGGGQSSLQVDLIQEIIHYLNLDFEKFSAEKISETLFDKNSRTFRKGKTGGFKNEMTKSNIDLFNSMHEDLLNQYGYELFHPK